MADFILSYPAARWALLAILFVAVALVSFASVNLFGSRRLARHRLAGMNEPDGGGQVSQSLRAEATQSAWVRLVNAIESSGLSLVDTRDDTLRGKLVKAGYTAPHAPRVYTLIRLVLVVGLPILVLGYLWLIGSRPSMGKLTFIAIISAAFGLYLPSLIVRAKADRRQREIINGFPDALDLMLVCVEAGLGLESAFGRVGMEMTQSHPLLAEQFGAVVLELRAGKSREDALRRMADRAEADEIRAFATLLIQSTKLGSSIAQTLRVYSAEMRERRRMRAEEKAHRLPVLLSIPLVACMLPVMIGVLMLPAAIRIMRAVVPALGGN